jgi:ABC-2 type transport system ATP-binding protein
MTVIEIPGLIRRFGDVVAANGLSFRSGADTVTGFPGPDHASTTTTVQPGEGVGR